jgi:hypothetical protein
MSAPDRSAVARRLLDVMAWSARRDYRGHDKHDALNSPLVSACTLGVPVLRLLATQAVMRFPFNTRPLLGVPAARNPKGIGLFAHACLDFADALRADPGLAPAERPEAWTARAADLLAWLVHHGSPNAPASAALRACFSDDGDPKPAAAPGAAALAGCGWGYHYPWQDSGFFQPRHFPNRVVTSWIGFAFLRAHEATGEPRFLDACREIATFLTTNPRVLFEDAQRLCLSYVPLPDIRIAVMDVSALVAAFLARLARRLPAGDPAADSARATAHRLMAFVVDKQTDYGAWFYTWPPGDSPIRHDNYHTGIILDCLADAIEFLGGASPFTSDDDARAGLPFGRASGPALPPAPMGSVVGPGRRPGRCTTPGACPASEMRPFLGEPAWGSAYRRGLDYYRDTLFTAEGAPRWMNDRTFPHDIHGAAAGILSFTRAALHARACGGDAAAAQRDLEMADRILRWTLAHLSDPAGFFYYQKGRIRTNRFCQMRWCNAWMSRALAQRLLTP